MKEGVAVGFFDGVHLGHQAILDGAAGALTFRNHPRTVLDPVGAPPLIMSVEARLAAIRACGVGEVVALDFTSALAAESPEAFLERLRGMNSFRECPKIRCGANWRFGRNGEGDADWLRAHGVAVEVVPYAEWKGGTVSSTRIRQALGRGEVEEAAAMLGRPYRLAGEVGRGKGLGARLGYPTVNLQVESALLPCGVYVVEAAGRRGLANFGLAPTFGEAAWKTPVLEIHFLENPPVASALEVDVLRFLRPERRFDSPEALRRQIAADLAFLQNTMV